MIKTRCKFQVTEIARIAWNVVSKPDEPKRYAERVKFRAVSAGESQEDQSFSSATPDGTLEIFVTNPAVVGTFEPDDAYYLDLIPVPKAAAA